MIFALGAEEKLTNYVLQEDIDYQMSLELVGQSELFSFTISHLLLSSDFKSVTWVPPDPLKTSRGGGQVTVLNVIPILTKIIMITIFFCPS